MERLNERKATLVGALAEINLALNTEEYSGEYKHVNQTAILDSDLKHPLLKEMLKRCNEKKSGFDPNLIVQHLEKEALDQFNEIVLSFIKGVSVDNLMVLRNELERLMLKERHDHYNREIVKIDKMLLESATGVTIENDELVKQSIKKKKK